VSISPTFYKQLLHGWVPKAQENTDDLTVFFELVKAASKTLKKLTPDLGIPVLDPFAVPHFDIPHIE